MFAVIHRYLDPSESLLEILFGLIMALTMTAGARLVSASDSFNAAELAVALIGCNLAWGIIDGVFYLMGARFNRNRHVLLVRRLQATDDPRQAIALVQGEFGLEGEPPTREEDRSRFHAALAEMLRHAGTQKASLVARDFVAAAIVCALVSLTALPGLLPLLLTNDATLALRLANGLQVILLFAIGFGWARYSGASPWRSATLVSLLGVGLVLVAVLLGG